MRPSSVPPARILFIATAAVVFFLQGFDSSFAENNLSDSGEIIYRSNEKSPNQIFIIGISHRDTLTRTNGRNTVKAQVETYEIGDWLIHHQGLELLLPEGFFSKKPANGEEEKISLTGLKKSKCIGSSDLKLIEERLADDRTFTNAEMLLNENHQLRLKQVEDEKSYDAVRTGVLKMVGNRSSSCDLVAVKSELDYLQEKRTAAMLQRIPGIVDDEFQQGYINAKKAIFTIGLSHLTKIIQYMTEGKIEIHSPLWTSGKNEDQSYVSNLNLAKENFGICIIIPKTLANDQRVLAMNGLDKIVALSRNRVSVAHSAFHSSDTRQ